MLNNIKKTARETLKTPDLKFIKELWRDFPTAEIFLVGGLVRDAALGVTSKDVDLVVRNLPAQKLQKFLTKHGRVNLVGKRFGVFKFLPRNSSLAEPIDIALPRTEHSLGTSAYRDFAVQSKADLPIEMDLARRDFTINALAWDVKNNRLVDPFGGLADLKKQRLRTVGKAKDRFTEDASRLLRALRFACQLNFKIEKNTWRAIIKYIGLLNKKSSPTPRRRMVIGLAESERVVPYEVIGKEIVKALVYSPALALKLLDQSGALKRLIPELTKTKTTTQSKKHHHEGTVWQHTLLALQKLESPLFKRAFPKTELNAQLVWAVLLHDIGKPATKKRRGAVMHFYGHELKGAKLAKKICEQLKLSQYQKGSRWHLDCEHLYWLIRHHLLVILSEVKTLRASTLEKFFFNPLYPGQTLLQLMWADMSASLRPNGRPDLTKFIALRRRLAKMSRVKKLPPPLLTGNEVMATLNLTPGPKVGLALAWLREEQLNGRLKTKAAAFGALKKHGHENL